MNEATSHEVGRILHNGGYSRVDDAQDADLILINTCSVREKAESRAKARIAQYCALKKRPPKNSPVVWVVGCMAERLGDALRQEIKGVDRTIGAPQLEYFEQSAAHWLAEDRLPPLKSLCGATGGYTPPGHYSAYVAIMRGCNNYCTYCIVPYVRGREHSRPAEDIVDEIARYVNEGITEITLLGQNVNSYRWQDFDFASLLHRVHEIDGLQRIRFTTSHPKDCSERLVETVACLPKCCAHIHLPVQSGSDRILSLMKRRYTRDHYLRIIDTIRDTIDDVDITTDVMVGFPTETYDEFRDTYSLFERVRFTDAFMFAYSARPGTAASTLGPRVDEDEKKSRLNELIELQTGITRMYYSQKTGTRVTVLPSFFTVDRAGNPVWKAKDYGMKNALVYPSDPGRTASPAAAPDGDGIEGGKPLECTVTRSSGKTLICERT